MAPHQATEEALRQPRPVVEDVCRRGCEILSSIQYGAVCASLTNISQASVGAIVIAKKSLICEIEGRIVTVNEKFFYRQNREHQLVDYIICLWWKPQLHRARTQCFYRGVLY